MKTKLYRTTVYNQYSIPLVVNGKETRIKFIDGDKISRAYYITSDEKEQAALEKSPQFECDYSIESASEADDGKPLAAEAEAKAAAEAEAARATKTAKAQTAKKK
ncbi:MAG: hypothetical protein LBG17_03180 [Bacteroidales bacterium]|nr:hypothetical protein [Bacteroidales bacterium]